MCIRDRGKYEFQAEQWYPDRYIELLGQSAESSLHEHKRVSDQSFWLQKMSKGHDKSGLSENHTKHLWANKHFGYLPDSLSGRPINPSPAATHQTCSRH